MIILKTKMLQIIIILLVINASLLCSQCSPQVYIESDDMVLYSGRVFHKLSNGRAGRSASYVDVVLKDSRSGINVTVRSNTAGYFRAYLRRGNYQINTSKSGYVIKNNRQTPELPNTRYTKEIIDNTFLKINKYRNPFNYFPSSTRYNDSNSQKTVVKPLSEGSPTVNIECSRDTVTVGEEFTITVNALDDDGLGKIWWYATYSKSRELSSDHVFECNGTTSISKDWIISINKPGSVVLVADATDVLFESKNSPYSHQASLSVELPEIHIYVAASDIK